MTRLNPMPTELLTRRLRLRPWRIGDAGAYRQLWLERDPRSLRRIDSAGRPTLDDLRDRIAAGTAGQTDSGLGLLVVERLVEGDFIGYCGLLAGDRSEHEPELAYELARTAHGQGFATEAAAAVVDAARTAGRSRLWAGVRVWNAASFRVLEKLRFERSEIVEDAEQGDLVMMTLRLQPGPGRHASTGR